MPTIAAFLYRHGRRVREIAIDERVDCPTDRSEFVWIGLTDPCADEIETLRRLYDLHPLAVEDALKDGQLPKVDVYGDQLFVIGRTAHLIDGHIVYGQTAAFLGHSHIITVRQGSTRSYKPLRDHLEASPDLLGQGGDYVLHAILDFIVDGYLPLMAALGKPLMNSTFSLGLVIGLSVQDTDLRHHGRQPRHDRHDVPEAGVRRRHGPRRDDGTRTPAVEVAARPGHRHFRAHRPQPA